MQEDTVQDEIKTPLWSVQVWWKLFFSLNFNDYPLLFQTIQIFDTHLTDLKEETNMLLFPPSGSTPFLSSHCGYLLILGSLFNCSLLADDLLQPLQTDVLRAQVSHASLAAMEQRQGVDVLQLGVANALVHHQIQQLIGSVVQHLIVLPEWRQKDELNRGNR